MYTAKFVFGGKTIHQIQETDLDFFPKKGEYYSINDRDYFIKSFSIIGDLVIYSIK